MKNFKKWLQLWDGLWTIPILFILVLTISSVLLEVWGPSVGIFRPGMLNAAFIAGFYFFTGYTLVNILINLNHRGWHRRYYNSKETKEDFKNLPAWLKVLFVPLLQLVLFLAFLWLVAQFI